MSLLKNTLRMLVWAAMAAAGSATIADQPYHPFAEPLKFDPDWQYFAPVDVQELEDAAAREKANYGWYATYDRIHAGLDRPLIEAESNKFDTTWGNRFTFGVMSEADKGWDFQFLHFSGPNAYTGTTAYRVIQSIPTATDPDPQLPGGAPQVPFDPNFGNGTFFIPDSLNVASLGSFEVNRTWRMSPYQYGGFLEPLVGIRYMDFTDVNVADGFTVFTDAIGTHEVFDVSHITTKNRMLLGQLGFRYFKDIERLRFSTEFKAFAGGNFQTGSVLSQQFEYIDGGTLFTIPFDALTNAPGLGDHGVVGMDTRVELSYLLTRSICFRSGVSLLYVGQGIARGSQIAGQPGGLSTPPVFGPSSSFVQQNMVMPGISFGLTINR